MPEKCRKISQSCQSCCSPMVPNIGKNKENRYIVSNTNKLRCKSIVNIQCNLQLTSVRDPKSFFSGDKIIVYNIFREKKNIRSTYSFKYTYIFIG